MQQNVIAVYAVSENGVIGKNNELPWHLPNDFRHFKQITLDKPIIMGRLTFESLGKPLPRRRHIVVTRRTNYQPDGVEIVHSLEDALSLCKYEPEVCIIGGSFIFEEAFNKGMIDKVCLTIVHAEVEGDVIFDKSFDEGWNVVSVDARQADDDNEYAYTFKTLEKITS